MTHPFDPVWNEDSRILILGSFPSVRSREKGFFYGHPQNRFWKVISAVFEAPIPVTIAEKEQFLLANGIALWDVIASCEVEGSADGSIRNALPNDLSQILHAARIEKIFTNGKLAHKLYEKYFDKNAIYLPSTSPANAMWRFEKLIDAWQMIRF